METQLFFGINRILIGFEMKNITTVFVSTPLFVYKHNFNFAVSSLLIPQQEIYYRSTKNAFFQTGV